MRLTAGIKQQIIDSVMADMNKIDYLEQANALIKKGIVALAPKVIRDAYKFDPSVFRYESMYRDGVYVNYPVLFADARSMAENSEEISPFIKQHKVQEQNRREARRILESLLAGCTTSKTLIVVAPELKKYIPSEAPKKDLPVVTGLKGVLVAAGWPKGARK